MTTFDASRRLKTTQAEVLQAFANRLLTLEGLSSQNVVISESPVPSMFPGGRMCLVVCGTDGEFSGPSSSQMTENAGVIIGVYYVNLADRPGRSESKLLNENSLYEMKYRVIKHLKIAEPARKWASRDWEPTRSVDGKELPILREPPRLLSSRGPIDVQIEHERSKWSGIQLFFSTVFDWALYE